MRRHSTDMQWHAHTPRIRGRLRSAGRRALRPVPAILIPIPIPIYPTRTTINNHPILLHPPQPIIKLLNREYLPRVLLDPAVALPDTAAFARVLEVRAEVRRALLAERFLQDVEVLAVAGGDGQGDFDGAVDVFDGPADAAGEARAALGWG